MNTIDTPILTKWPSTNDSIENQKWIEAHFFKAFASGPKLISHAYPTRVKVSFTYFT